MSPWLESLSGDWVAPTPGLAPGWGPDDAVLGDVHILDLNLFIRGF